MFLVIDENILVALTVTRPVQDPLAVTRLQNRLYIPFRFLYSNLLKMKQLQSTLTYEVKKILYSVLWSSLCWLPIGTFQSCTTNH